MLTHPLKMADREDLQALLDQAKASLSGSAAQKRDDPPEVGFGARLSFSNTCAAQLHRVRATPLLTHAPRRRRCVDADDATAARHSAEPCAAPAPAQTACCCA